MKQFAWPFLLSILVLAPRPAVAAVVDKAVATVNGDPILKSEFEKNSGPIMEQFKRATPLADQTPERLLELKKKVLDQMVDDKLLTQQAKKQKIKVSKLEVDDGVNKVKKRFPDEKAFEAEMKGEGFTPERFRTHIEDQLSVIKLIEKEVKAKTVYPTDSEVKALYANLDAIYNGKQPTGKLSEDDKEDLQTLARLLGRRFGERVRARHILIRLSNHATDKEKAAAREKLTGMKARLAKGEEFDALAKQYSEDPGSKDRGGDLGYFTKGDMVPPFEKVAFTLPVGALSDPVETDFGAHLIRVDEKRAATKFSYEDIQNDLRDYLFQQKAAQRFEDYLKDLRKSATVQVQSLE